MIHIRKSCFPNWGRIIPISPVRTLALSLGLVSYANMALTGFIIRSEYGPLLQAPPTMPKEYQISRALTSAMGVACLRADGGVGPQLTSHVFGLLKAQGWEGESEEDKWLATEEGAQWVVELTDELSDVLAYGQDKAQGRL